MKQLHLLSDGAQPKVAQFLHHLSDNFPFYKRRFAALGLPAEADASLVFDQSPVLTPDDYSDLEGDVLNRVSDRFFLVDLTSGTTGPRRTRYATAHDDAAEADLCRRFFNQCSVSQQDRVLAVDIGNPDLYLFYGHVFQTVGVDLFTFGNVTSDFTAPFSRLLGIKPTVLLTIPSVLARFMPALRLLAASGGLKHLRKVIYLGETLPDILREDLNKCDIEVFGLYGSTEIGSMAGECIAHAGMHIYDDAVVATLLEPVVQESCVTGEVVWTTLHFVDQPLLKYATRDVVTIDTAPCNCGLTSPRLLTVGRVQEQFIVYGHKFEYSGFLDALADVGIKSSFLQIIVDDSPCGIAVTFILPQELRWQEGQIMEALGGTDEMPYFCDLGFLQYDCVFVAKPLASERKLRRVIDQRMNGN